MKFSGSVAMSPLVRKDCHPSHSCWDVLFLTTVSHVLADVSMGRQMSLHSHRVCYVLCFQGLHSTHSHVSRLRLVSRLTALAVTCYCYKNK